MTPVIVIRGGIKIERDGLGNLTIHARGNGKAHVQRADVADLRAALDDLESVDPKDKEHGE